MNLSLDNRTFVPFENSEGGVVDDRTIFQFSQTGRRFEATYAGGDIHNGHIIGHFTGQDSGQMLYHCETQDGALKAGHANAIFENTADGGLTMSLDWVWISGGEGSGTSKYIELTERKS